MASIRRSRRAERFVSNVRLPADGGCIFADARNAGTSAAATVRQVSTRRNTTPLPVTRSSRVSSRASGGFTTIGRSNSSPARSFTLRTRVRWINRCPDRPARCLQTGKRCFTNEGRPLGSLASRSARNAACRAPAREASEGWKRLRAACLARDGHQRTMADCPTPDRGVVAC
jgi:hypothetical protein